MRILIHFHCKCITGTQIFAPLLRKSVHTNALIIIIYNYINSDWTGYFQFSSIFNDIVLLCHYRYSCDVNSAICLNLEGFLKLYCYRYLPRYKWNLCPFLCVCVWLKKNRFYKYY